MIPQFSFKVSELEEKKNSNLTYKLDLVNKRIYGKIDDYDAANQAIMKILLTERFENIVYDDGYGIEAKRFIGKDIDFIKSDIERTIKESLLVDDRVLEVFNFTSLNKSDVLAIEFEVRTIYGSINIKSEVRT
ncbi:MAG: DUF2634 domain-containing protein [Clostridium sp.]